MSICQLCRTRTLTELLDLGPQPISNRFLADPAVPEALFPFVLSQCPACSLAQLSQAVPASELESPYPWISYHEPESHLDQVALGIAGLPGLTAESLILGLSFKDDTLLGRLAARGFRHTRRLDPARDLGLDARGAGVASIQDRLSPGRATGLIASYGRPQVIVARHIVEHAHDLQRFLAGLVALLRREGFWCWKFPTAKLPSGWAITQRFGKSTSPILRRSHSGGYFRRSA